MKKTGKDLKDNYVVIQSWMVRELGLKANSAILYALIYGFSQTDGQACTCGIEYMQKWIGGAKSTVIRALNDLEGTGLITRVYGQDEDGRVTGYVAVRPSNIGSEMRPIDRKQGSNSRPIEQKEGSNSRPKKVAICNEIGRNLIRATDNNYNILFFVDEKELSKLLGTTIDCEPAHSLEEYKKVAAELERSTWARKNFTHLSKIHCNWDRLVSGYYRDRIDSVANVESYSAADLNAIFNQISEDEI